MGEHAVLATTAADLARVVLEQGRDAEAAALCAASERLAAPEDVATQAMWRGVRARLLAGEGEHARAEALAREAVALIDPTDLLNDRADVLLDLAAVLQRGGRAEEAGRIRERALALYEAKGNRISATRARAGPRRDRRHEPPRGKESDVPRSQIEPQGSTRPRGSSTSPGRSKTTGSLSERCSST